MIDVILLLIMGAVTWCVASEGARGAALTCLCVIFSGLLAMNFFEPLANFLQSSVAGGSWGVRWDIVALVGLFAGFVLGLREATDRISPTYVQIQGLLYEIVRWGAGLLTGYVTMAFLLTSLHTAPLPREFIGFRPERNNFLNVAAPDRQWLGFTQYVSEKIFRQGPGNRIFDGPQLVVGDPKQPYPNRVWPSFPIRYAHRRQMLSAMGPAAAGGQPGGGTTIQRKEAPQRGGATGF